MPDNPAARGHAPSQLLFSPRQAAEQLSISRATLYRLRKSGELGPFKKHGRRSFLTRQDLERFIASLPTKER